GPLRQKYPVGALPVGMITDYFVASDEEVRQTNWENPEEDPVQGFPNVDMLRMDPLQLASLETALGGASYEPGTLYGDVAWEDEEGGAWVWSIPDKLTILLAQVDADQ